MDELEEWDGRSQMAAGDTHSPVVKPSLDCLVHELFGKNFQQLPPLWLWGTGDIWLLSCSINSAGELKRTSLFNHGSLGLLWFVVSPLPWFPDDTPSPRVLLQIDSRLPGGISQIQEPQQSSS